MAAHLHHRSAQSLIALGGVEASVTVLIDPDGSEIGPREGPAQWDTARVSMSCGSCISTAIAVEISLPTLVQTPGWATAGTC